MPTMSEVTSKAFKLREYIAKKEADLKAELAPLKVTAEKLDNWMLAWLIEQGLQRSAVPGFGTIYRKNATSVKVADWDAALGWIQKNERWDCLNHAVNKTTVVAYIADKGEPPPGISYTVIAEIGMQAERSTSDE